LREEEEGSEKMIKGATFPPFFPLSFFFLFLFFSSPSPPFRRYLKVFHQHDLKALTGGLCRKKKVSCFLWKAFTVSQRMPF
jgi:hypothetical protein